MTNDSKENLLKILLNEKQEKQGIIRTQPQVVANKTDETPTNYNQREYYTYNGYVIIVTTESKVVIVDSQFNEVFNDYLYINNQAFWVESITIDNEGTFYCFAKNQTTTTDTRLVYLNNITEPIAEGTYKLVPKKTYKLYDMFVWIRNDIKSKTTTTNTYNAYDSYKLIKSPYDSRFVILCGGHTYNINENTFMVVYYKVNFGYGENEYDYRVTSINDYERVRVTSGFASFTDDNVSIGACCLNSSMGYTNQTPGPIAYYYASADFTEGSEITTRKLLEEENYVTTTPSIYGGTTLQTDISTTYIPMNIRDTTTNKTTLRIYRFNARTTKKIYEQLGTAESAAAVSFAFPLYVNNQVFFGIVKQNATGTYIGYLHIIKDTIDEILINSGSVNQYWYRAMLLNTYDLYNFYISQFVGTFVFRTNDYNGNSYFNDTSLVATSSKLYTQNTSGTSYPIYAKELYDRVLGGNTINSVTQVPYTILNDIPITKEDLLSKTNTTITSTNKEYTKNQYEELYINNIDTFKVWDNNNGSTYNQNASIQVAKNIYDGFKDEYKIKKYRINYNDSSYSDYDLEKPTRTNNEAIIKIGVYNTGIKNIEIYDDNFTTPFITIDTSSLELNKLYTIIQKIKIE